MMFLVDKTKCRKVTYKLLSCFVCLLMVMGSIATASAASFQDKGFTYVINSGYACITSYDAEDTNVVIPDKLGDYYVKEISDYAFMRDEKVESVSFVEAKHLKRIGIDSFFGCTSLKSISIPFWVDELSFASFQNCTSLEKVTFSNNLKTVPDQLFAGCTSLNNVSLPDSVSSIGNLAFSDCTALKSIKIGASAYNIADNAFYNVDTSLVVYCYGNSVALNYAQTKGFESVLIDSYQLGDVNLDGNVDVEDATLIQRYLSEMATLSLQAKYVADYNGDGYVTVADATAIQYSIVLI